MRRIFRFFISATLLAILGSDLAVGGPGQTTAHHGWAEGRWAAQWIACREAPQRDAGVFHFRKTLDLTDLPTEFVVHVSADNRFILFVNGARVGEGPANSDLSHWKYETFDLGPFLHNGKNVIAATVWNFGAQAPLAQMTSRAGFILQGDGATEQIAQQEHSRLIRAWSRGVCNVVEEMIDIDEQQPDRLAFAVRLRPECRQLLVERAPIAQPRQTVAPDELAQQARRFQPE